MKPVNSKVMSTVISKSSQNPIVNEEDKENYPPKQLPPTSDEQQIIEYLGDTDKSITQIMNLANDLWSNKKYNLNSDNCLKFCESICHEIGIQNFQHCTLEPAKAHKIVSKSWTNP